MSEGEGWLFSRRTDVAVFGGSALLTFVLLCVGFKVGVSAGTTPDWAWVPAVLLVDVAHVWSTGFRVYFDRREVRKHPRLYAVVPAVSFVAGVVLYRLGAIVFWRAVAYLAIFHFVRHGWMALYRARRGDTARIGRVVDTAAIYAAILYPLLYWHTHAPRSFDWLMPGDIVALPTWLDRIGFPIYVLWLLVYAARSIAAWICPSALGDRPSPGKDLLVLTTAVCWYVGIVALDSDYSFTVTNVFTHGIPYIVLVFWWKNTHEKSAKRLSVSTLLGTIWALAYAEELLWDRAIWGERSWLFGSAWDLGPVKSWVVPLLALPQLTHYVLDGFLWRRRMDSRVDRIFFPVGRKLVPGFAKDT